jgi:uncharacterized protein YpmS
MNTLDKHFKIIMLVLSSLTFLLVLSIKVSTCSLSNDMRTTKKTTKALNEKTITAEDLNKSLQTQTEEYLTKEKLLDKTNDTIAMKRILQRDTTKNK